GRAGGLAARLLGAGSPIAGDGLTVRQLGRVVAWHVPARLFGLLEIAILFALLGLPVTLVNVLFADSLLNAAGFISFPIPQALGVFEGTIVYAFDLLGYPSALAVTFALARRGRLLTISIASVLLHLLSFSKPRGRPRPPADWDAEYESGHWNFLDSTREMGHYEIIAAYVDDLTDRPRVLDVGCGHGRLYRLLQQQQLASYLGIDISTQAIHQAQVLATDGVIFAVRDFETAPPPGPHDVIVFNESIYYAADPTRTFDGYLDYLAESGIMIVSIRHRLKNRRLRTAIHRMQQPAHSTTITNDAGERWHVDVFSARR
ncbi:MAG: hypothetical protein QOG52_2762, partial [Frankiaceae bacterium]|nr:hypothetical protein [Frankiaceae bacterium]